MSSVLSTQGLTETVNNEIVPITTDSTRGDVVSQYLSGLNPIANLAALVQNSAQNANLTPDNLQSQGYVTQVSNSLTSMLALAQNGLLDAADPTDPNSPQTRYYLTDDMAQGLNQLIESFQVAGINVTNGNPPTVSNLNGTTLRKWLDLSTISPIIGQVIGNAQQAAESGTSTLQALVELVYVKTANNVLSDQMVSLENALQLTENVLTTLTSVQQLHNSVDPATLAAVQKADLTTSNNETNAITAVTGINVNDNIAAGGAFTDIALQPQMVTQNSAQYSSLQSQLQSQLNALVAENPGNVNTDLYKRVTQVLSDMQANNSNQSNWYLDGFSTSGTTQNSGVLQQNINAAITSGENLNNSQQQNVQNFMFVFQEYYQSASTALAKLSQIIEQAAQAVKG